MAAVDPRAHLESTTRGAYGRLVNDLKAVPTDKQNVSPGGCTRTPLYYIAECAAINGFVAHFLTTGRMSDQINATPEERERVLSSFNTEEKALAFLSEQTEALFAAFRNLDPETLGDTTNALFGRPMTFYTIAEMPAMHMAYHDGQLCHTQMLNGDPDMHWG